MFEFSKKLLTFDGLFESTDKKDIMIIDVVVALQNDIQFSKKVRVTKKQLQMVLYFGFLGKGIKSESDILKVLKRLNIEISSNISKVLESLEWITDVTLPYYRTLDTPPKFWGYNFPELDNKLKQFLFFIQTHSSELASSENSLTLLAMKKDVVPSVLFKPLAEELVRGILGIALVVKGERGLLNLGYHLGITPQSIMEEVWKIFIKKTFSFTYPFPHEKVDMILEQLEEYRVGESDDSMVSDLRSKEVTDLLHFIFLDLKHIKGDYGAYEDESSYSPFSTPNPKLGLLVPKILDELALLRYLGRLSLLPGHNVDFWILGLYREINDDIFTDSKSKDQFLPRSEKERIITKLVRNPDLVNKELSDLGDLDEKYKKENL